MRKPFPWAWIVLVGLFVLVAGLAIATSCEPGKEMRYPVESQDVAVPHETTTVVDVTLSPGGREVRVVGRDGTLRVFTYYEETWVRGSMRDRRRITPAGKPASSWVTSPTMEVVALGTGDGTLIYVDAADPKGIVIGKIGSSGKLTFRIAGTITFAGAETACGPAGNPFYRRYQKPLRADVRPGAALVRVAKNKWHSLGELGWNGRSCTVRGKKGDRVRLVVNDAVGYYADNRGAFVVSGVVSR